MVKYCENLQEFDSYLKQTDGGKLMVVDFTASWCGPCRMIAPVFEMLAKNNTDVIFIKVDVDNASDIAEKYQIQAMPTFKFFKNGVEVKQLQGANKDALANFVATLK